MRPSAVMMAVLSWVVVPGWAAAQPASDAAELRRLVDEFLAGASRNDVAVHERFWADELVYTGSSGRRVGKADIVKDLRAAPASPASSTPLPVYSSEDVRIQQHGDTAVVAFRLVATTAAAGGPEIAKYLNTGTFLKRGGRWQAIAWQATRLPRPEDEARSAAAAVHAAVDRALLAADAKALGALLDEGFTWTQASGERQGRQQLLDALTAGALRYSRLQSSDVTASIHGPTAIVRGTTTRQRSACPECPASGDSAPFTAFFTLTLADLGPGWKAVALHTSRTH
jgi:hypothetical protein